MLPAWVGRRLDAGHELGYRDSEAFGELGDEIEAGLFVSVFYIAEVLGAYCCLL